MQNIFVLSTPIKIFMSNPGPLFIIIRTLIITLICIACRNTTKPPAAQHTAPRPAIDSLIARTEIV